MLWFGATSVDSSYKMIAQSGERKTNRSAPRRANRPKMKRNKGKKKNFVNPRGVNPIPFPDCLRTKFLIEAYCYTTSGAGSGAYTWTVAMNSLFQPFNTGNVSGLTPVNASLSTMQPIGYSNLCNANIYTEYRVLASEIFVNVIPQSVTDACFVSITPTKNNNTTVYANTRLTTTCVMSANRDPPTKHGLRNRIRVGNFFGVKDRAIQDDLSGGFTSTYAAVPNVPFYWNIWVQAIDGSTFTDPVGVEFRIIYDAELFALTNASLAKT